MTQPTPQSSIRRLPNGQHELRLQGRFYHPHWLAFLLSGLAHLKISVVSGKATRAAAPEWDAVLLLDFRHSGAIPEQLDLPALMEKPAHLDTSSVQLTFFQISKRADGTLEVHLKGPDQLGFLGRFLTKVSLLGLYPSEVKIDTVAGRIDDRIALNGLAGASAGAAQQESLNTMLRSLQS